MSKQETLQSAYDARVDEVEQYQINIDNYRLAIAEIADDDVELQPFKQQLQDLLKSSLLEQRKAAIMLKVIKAQLD